MIEQVYPSGRVVKNTLDADGQLQQVESRKANDTFRNYANAFSYTAAGAVSAMRLGNGLWERTEFNSRLQPVMIGLGTGSAVQNRLRLDYAYGEMQSNGTIDATKNNGNLTRQTITVPTVITGGTTHTGFTAVQNYQYDSLNRLKSAVENVQSLNSSNQPVGSQSLSWRQTYTFDRYGNRRFDAANTTTLPKNCGVPQNPNVCPEDIARLNPEINPANNRLSSPGWQYDAAGNTIQDAEGRSFIYDGENKQTEVRNAQHQVIGKYYFDGDGKRVKKVVSAGVNGSAGETTVFVYDASAKLVAEYSTVLEPQATAKTSYLTQDHLGSPRILTDANGNTISCRDFLPYGEEIVSPQRTQSLGYTADAIRQKFTGYERDAETNLDYAKARYYKSAHGHFTSPDPFGPWAMDEDEKTEFSLVPQQWNRYAYVLNNPVRLSDPTGLEVYDGTVSEEQQAIIRKALQSIAKNGNREQRAVANWILKNDILISLIDRSSTVDGTAGLQSGNGEALSQRLEKGYISKEEAASYLQIKLNEGIVGNSDFAQAVLEGVLNHEGRHAWVKALAIQSVSSDCGQRCYYSISNFTDELKAFQTEASYLLNRANAGNAAAREAGLGGRGRFNLLSEENGRLQVNEGKIREILSQTYGLDENRQGLTTIQSLQNSGVRIPARPKR